MFLLVKYNLMIIKYQKEIMIHFCCKIRKIISILLEDFDIGYLIIFNMCIYLWNYILKFHKYKYFCFFNYVNYLSAYDVNPYIFSSLACNFCYFTFESLLDLFISHNGIPKTKAYSTISCKAYTPFSKAAS